MYIHVHVYCILYLHVVFSMYMYAHLCSSPRPHSAPPPPGHCWFEFNDTHVSPTVEGAIEKTFQGKQSAYMLFYRLSSLSRPDEGKPRYTCTAACVYMTCTCTCVHVHVACSKLYILYSICTHVTNSQGQPSLWSARKITS